MASSNRIWIGAVLLMAALLVALIAVFVWRERSRPDDNKEFTSGNLRSLYPGYFRNLTEQATFKSIYIAGFENPKPVSSIAITPNNQTCNVQCNLGFRKRRSRSQAIYHGCCQSYVDFLTPTQLPNLASTMRNIIQLDNIKQYFLQHNCSRVLGCNGCRCSQTDDIYTAVVLKHGVTDADDMEDIEIDFFKLIGCCRCINAAGGG